MSSTYQFIAAKPKVEFRDFDLNFGVNPVSGDLLVKNTEDSIKQSIKHLVLTNFYEAPFNPTKGSQITGALFEIYSKELEIILRKEIYRVISVFEPRVKIREIAVGYNSNLDTVRARVDFIIIGQTATSTLDMLFERVR